MHQQRAVLALEDGQIFEGYAIGAHGETVGEVVFNTAMTGYQEILTDPSYTKQIINFTSSHIGNTGTNDIDNESQKIHAAGLIVRDLALLHSNWRAQNSLNQFLIEQNIIGIANIDTRALTRKIRNTGSLRGCIQSTPTLNPERALQCAREFHGMAHLDLAKEVSTTQAYLWTEGIPAWHVTENATSAVKSPTEIFHVVAYDFGVKRNILRLLVEHGCRLTVVPATTSAREVLELKPDGIFLSNGPGDPAACGYAIAAIQELLATKIPIFGICLGFQLLALACGAHTFKMKFGHRGANHPILNLLNQKVFVSSQNHGFALVEEQFPAMLEITHRSLFDHTIQGIRHRTQPAFAFQGHPEASPGPTELTILFAEFSQMMASHQKKNCKTPVHFADSMEKNLHA